MFKLFLPDLSKRAIGLDLLRAAAILMVLIYHAWIFVAGFFPKAGLLFFLGYWGVELFFVLSGFLIGGILITKVLQAETLSLKMLVDFWKRRWIRTIPIYLIALIINFLSLNYIVGYPTTFDFRYLFFLQNTIQSHPAFFPEAWSLSVEEWFYISLPLGVLLAFIIPAKNKENRLLMVFLLLLCLFTYARFTQFQGQFELSAWDKNIRKVVAFRLDALMYGVLAAWFFKTKTQLVLPFKNTLLIVGMLLVPLAYFIFYKKYFPFFNVVFFTSISSLGFALSLFSFANWKGPKNIKLVNGITYLSVISYSLYLIHYTFLFRILNNFIIASTLLNASVLFVSYLLLSIILASLFHYYFEKPFLKMKEKMNA